MTNKRIIYFNFTIKKFENDFLIHIPKPIFVASNLAENFESYRQWSLEKLVQVSQA